VVAFCWLLLVAGTAPAAAEPREHGDWWFAPFERLALTASAFDDAARPYDTPLHPRQIAGALDVSCEHVEARPCGDGALAFGEIDSRGGFGDIVAIATRVRPQLGTQIANTVAIDRAHVDVRLGPVAAEVGRDAVRFGPQAARTQLAWGDNAPPLDHVRVSTSAPWRLGSDRVHGSATYLVGRPRAPQRYPGMLVTIGRGQLDLGRDGATSIAIVHLLQVEGEGAPHLGVWDFIAEHLRRKDLTASETDTSNRRFGGDVATRIAELGGLRLYYELVFEDIRKRRVVDALRYDADHLVGAALPWVTVEYQQTAARSQEHSARTTGFTSGGHAAGSPLGPDGRSLYAAARARLAANVDVEPWVELVQLRNRTLEYVNLGPITPVSQGEDEARYRAGERVDVPLRPDLMVEGEAMVEHVDDVAFEPRATQNNAGIRATIAWFPRR
jgi:hypothetical protein